MKKILAAVLVVSVLLIVSCASTQSVDDQYKAAYDKASGLKLGDAKKYTVTSGDTMTKIARDQYGNGLWYPVIMLASKGTVINPDKIEPGMVLTIPNLETNKADPDAKKSMKTVLTAFAAIEKREFKRNENAEGMKKLASSL